MMDTDRRKPLVGFIGAGTVGTALAVSLSLRGYPVVAVASRSRSSAERLAGGLDGCQIYAGPQGVADAAELVFITTPDDAIGPVVAAVSWRPGQGVVHCNGAASTQILEPARRWGALVGGFHPLQTFAGVQEALENLPGSTFALEAEGSLLETLKDMAQALGGRWVLIRPEDKVLYHLAAVLACNYLVTMVKLATDIWLGFGVPQDQATQALIPLLRGTLNNIEKVGLPHCLTGPIARGDMGTIQNHLKALERSAPGLLPTYCELGLQTIPIALAKGRIDAELAEGLRQALRQAQIGSKGGKR